MRALSRASAASKAFWTMVRAVFGFSSRKRPRKSPTDEVDDALDLAVAELGLGLAFELRVGDAEGDDGSQTFAEVVAGGDEVLEERFLLAVVVESAREGGAESGEVRAALRSW